MSNLGQECKLCIFWRATNATNYFSPEMAKWLLSNQIIFLFLPLIHYSLCMCGAHLKSRCKVLKAVKRVSCTPKVVWRHDKLAFPPIAQTQIYRTGRKRVCHLLVISISQMSKAFRAHLRLVSHEPKWKVSIKHEKLLSQTTGRGRNSLEEHVLWI